MSGGFTVLYFDKDIVVCDKSAGLLSQPDEKGSENLLDLLSQQFSKKVGLVHRLDRGVGGAVVYALSGSALSSLNKQLKDGTISKTYLAVVHGKTDEMGDMTDFLFKDKAKNKSYAVKTERKGTKKAVLSYKTLSQNEAYSLVEVSLQTGRFHQIRCQFSSRKHPIVGDGKYGSKENVPIALYCKSLSFYHPNTKELLTFTAQNRADYPFDLFKL